MLEREEMERQLDSAKTELFSEKRHTREKLESMQEVKSYHFFISITIYKETQYIQIYFIIYHLCFEAVGILH